MKTKTRLVRWKPDGIMVLLLSFAALEANAAMIMHVHEFSFVSFEKRTLAINASNSNGVITMLAAAHITSKNIRSGGQAAYDNESGASATVTSSGVYSVAADHDNKSEASVTITLGDMVSLDINTLEIPDLSALGFSSSIGGFMDSTDTSSIPATIGVVHDIGVAPDSQTSSIFLVAMISALFVRRRSY